MNELEKRNTVKADAQVSKWVTFEGTEGGSPRIMFVGNSITRHAPLAEIGWFNDWGMAASSKENDYVHLVISEVLKKLPNASFCITQAAVWERNYTNLDYAEHFAAAREFNPDIILCAISANIPDEIFNPELYCEEIYKLTSYLSKNSKTVKIAHTTSFFNNEKKNEGIKLFCEKYGARIVPISDIHADESNLAIGLFEHEGIQVHPGDKGMKAIADRLCDALRDFEII